MKEPHFVDFETTGIRSYPNFPPPSIGFSYIKAGSSTPHYVSYGSVFEKDNTHTKAEAKKILKALWNDLNHPVCFHHAMFDITVAQHDFRFKLKFPPGFHDTMFLAFLFDPRSPAIGLKPLAVKHLGMDPNEQDKLKEWILKNIEGTHDAKKSKKPQMHYMNFLAFAPVRIVGKYANGDVLRTKGLYEKFMPDIHERGMDEAYARELELMPVIQAMELGGVRINRPKLKRDVKAWKKAVGNLELDIFRKLKCEPFNINSSPSLGKHLKEADALSYIPKTDKGNFSTSRESLGKAIKNKQLSLMLQLYNILDGNLTSFALPWLRKSENTDDILHPKFHQTRGRETDKGGARTGRLSSTDPNFQNMNRPPTPETFKKFSKLLIKYNTKLPTMREYIIPMNKNMVLLKRDYSQQEPKILAHFENDKLCAAYQDDPELDVYRLAMALVYETTRLEIGRYDMKQTFLALIYGLGAAKLAVKLNCTVKHAGELKRAVLKSLPGLKRLNNEIKRIVIDEDKPIKTWGGRLYFCEPPEVDEHTGEVLRRFEYKLLNVLIQGSAADCTKQAMIQIYEALKQRSIPARLIIQVHDEVIVESLKSDREEVMKLMKEEMESVKFNVPMLSDGFKGINFGSMRSYL